MIMVRHILEHARRRLAVLGRARGETSGTNVESLMTNPVHACHADQTLQSVWESIAARSLRCTPVLDDSQRPQGIVHARDVARALLDEVASEELLLRDYVLGVGYQ
jgi:CBS domain-containing protein